MCITNRQKHDGIVYICMGCFLSSARSSILPWKEMAKISRQNVPNTIKKKCANLLYLYSRLLVLLSINRIGYFMPVRGQYRSFPGVPLRYQTYIRLSIGQCCQIIPRKRKIIYQILIFLACRFSPFAGYNVVNDLENP